MGRPSKKAERQTQILDAFGRVVSRYGLAGATQDRVAEEAGLARALIRHNLGNQDDVSRAFIARFLDENRLFLDALYQALPTDNRLVGLVDLLFDPAWNDGETTHISEALIMASRDDTALRREMQTWLSDIHDLICKVILEQFPETSPDRLSTVCVGLTGIWFNADSLVPLDQQKTHQHTSKQAALMLVDMLA